MAFAIVSRALMRTSKEILERNLAMGSATVLNGVGDVDEKYQRHTFVPQRGMSTSANDGPGPFVTQLQQQKQQQQQQKLLHAQEQHNALVQSTRKYAEKHKLSKKRDEESDSDSDSDDEFERVRQRQYAKVSQRGDSEFWRRKMRTLHRILDVNRDGVISFDDFNLLAKRFTDLGHLSPELSVELMAVMRETWEEQFGEITPYNLVTAEQFLVDLHHRLNDKKMAKRIGRFLPYLFRAVDYDHTGHLDLEQYKLFFRCLGLSEEDAAISFAVIDKNGDGQLSMKEFNHLGRQFFLTEDETKISKMFWGPLIDH